MAVGINVSFDDLETVTGIALPDASRTALDVIVRRLIAGAYAAPLDEASGRAADVLSSVYMSAAVRVMTNPSGARAIGLGSANVTFGGTDIDVANAFTLTAPERADLASLSATRPVYVVMRRRLP